MHGTKDQHNKLIANLSISLAIAIANSYITLIVVLWLYAIALFINVVHAHIINVHMGIASYIAT